MLVNPAQRTKALYAWEREMEQWPGFQKLTLARAQKLLDEVWYLWGARSRYRKPELMFRDMEGHSYFRAGEGIILNKWGRDNITLIHEATHALGWGSATNPHSEGFVERYTLILSAHMQPFYKPNWKLKGVGYNVNLFGPWDLGYLRAEAEMRLLVKNFKSS